MGRQKRVRFADVLDEVIAAPEAASPSGGAARTEAAAGDRAETSGGPGGEWPGGQGVSPEVAIAQRAARRRETELRDGEDGTTFLRDVRDAEEEYDEPLEAFNDGGVPIEPFHLKHERQEGYFDSDGHYVPHRGDLDVHDAWLETLDASSIWTKSGGRATAGDQAVEVEVDEDDLLAYKKRLVDLLLPEETVLRGLHRLGSETARPTANGSTEVGAVECSAQVDRGRKKPAAAKRKVPPENRAAFDKMTEYASLLLLRGDYNVYSQPREEMERELRSKGLDEPPAPKPIGESSAEAPDGDRQQRMAADADVDMFGDEDEAAASDAGGTPHAGGRIVDRPQSQPSVEGRESANAPIPGPAPGVGPQGPDGSTEGSGYAYDASSGYYYNSEAGCYYDPATGLVGDSGSGLWYRYTDGEYRLAGS